MHEVGVTDLATSIGDRSSTVCVKALAAGRRVLLRALARVLLQREVPIWSGTIDPSLVRVSGVRGFQLTVASVDRIRPTSYHYFNI